MPQGPSLIFDKSALESLNLDEAVMMDNFYMSTITPLFFVECLADLEKALKSKSTPEQLVGSLANRTPDMQGYPNAHHLDILRAELSRNFDLAKVFGRVALSGGRRVELEGKSGAIFQQAKEAEAFIRWSRREFLAVEREISRQWRRSLTSIDLEAMVKRVSEEIGPWRMPKSVEDAKQLADAVIDYLDPEFLLNFGLDLLGVPESTEWVVNDWKQQRRPNLRRHVPYFVFMLTINIFFCFLLRTQLLKNVKQSHMVDLAYLYYLPFCSVFTSKDNFHVRIVPLFLGPMQDFINGDDFKQDLGRLVDTYSSLPEETLKKGLIYYAAHPPDDQSFITTRMWDKYLPDWRAMKHPKEAPKSDPDEHKRLLAEIQRLSEAPDIAPDDGRSLDELNYVSLQREIWPQKGKWLRYSEEQTAGMRRKKAG